LIYFEKKIPGKQNDKKLDIGTGENLVHGGR